MIVEVSPLWTKALSRKMASYKGLENSHEDEDTMETSLPAATANDNDDLDVNSEAQPMVSVSLDKGLS